MPPIITGLRICGTLLYAEVIYVYTITVSLSRAIVYQFLPLFVLVLLTACGPFVSAPESTPIPTATATPDIQPSATRSVQTSATPIVPPTPEQDRLTLWTTERADDLAFVRTLAADFGEQTNVTVTVVPKSAGGLRADIIAVEMAGGGPPDLIWGDQDDLAGLLVDNQLQSIELAETSAAFISAAIDSATYDGQIWGQPIAVHDFLLLLYNRALITQPPQTTDDLIMQSRAVQQPDQFGIAAAWAEARWLLPWLNGFGGTLTTADGRRPTLDTPEMRSALDLLLELRIAAPTDLHGYAENSTLFSLGQAAIAIDGDWSIARYRTITPPLDLGIAPLPQIPTTGRVAAATPGSTYIMIHRSLAEHKQADADAFMRFLTEPDTQVQIASALQRLPALRTVLTDPAITEDTVLRAAAAQAETASGMPPTRALRCALRAINGQLPLLLDDQIDQEQATTVMQQSAEACIQE